MERESLTLFVLLGKTISQLFLHKERGKLDAARRMARRVLESVDVLLGRADISAGGVAELRILHDIGLDAVSEKSTLHVSRHSIEEYFRPFALRVIAMNNRGGF